MRRGVIRLTSAMEGLPTTTLPAGEPSSTTVFSSMCTVTAPADEAAPSTRLASRGPASRGAIPLWRSLRLSWRCMRSSAELTAAGWDGKVNKP